MRDFELIDTLDVGNTLGECILWDAHTQSAWWTDIHESRLYRYALAGKQLQVMELPGRLCSFGFIDGDSRLVCAFAEGFALYDPATGERQWLYRPEAGYSGTRFNDGRVDRQGRFWSGTMVESENATDAGGQPVKGSLYWVSPSANGRALQGIGISNSLCWSRDGGIVYFADSPTAEIRAWDFAAASAAFSNERVLARTPEGSSPDGSVIDAQDCLWNAHWGGGKVVRFSPQGDVMTEIGLPVSQPTCVCFGGPGLDLLFVTTAREHLDDAALARQPAAGNVFIYRTAFKGLPENRYRLA